MQNVRSHRDRIQEIRRIFEEEGFGNVELLEDWDGERLDDLASLLTDEEFEMLQDRLGTFDDDGLRP